MSETVEGEYSHSCTDGYEVSIPGREPKPQQCPAPRHKLPTAPGPGEQETQWGAKNHGFLRPMLSEMEIPLILSFIGS